MRITNQMMSTSYMNDLNKNLNKLNTLNKQLTTGKEISRPSDNPFKTARIMQMYSDIAANEQYNENIKDTISWLDTTDTALDQLGNASQRIRELMVSAGNASYGSDELKAIKDEINEKISEVAQILNTNYDGKYIFGGTKSTSKPVGVEQDVDGNNVLVFKAADGTSFNEEGKKFVYDANGKIAKDGNGNLMTEADATYEDLIKQMETGVSVEVSSGVTMEYNVGAPSVVSLNNGTSLVSLLNNIVNNLDDGKSSEILSKNLEDIDSIITNISSVRGEVGAKQNRMDSAKTQNEEQNINMEEILSNTEDIDIAEKTIDLATLQAIYQASLQVSASIVQKSLVDYI